MKRTFGSLGVVSVALLIIFSFQNCAQPGDISKVQGDGLANAMEIVPNVATGNEFPPDDFLPTPNENTLPTPIVANMPAQPISNPPGPTPQTPGVVGSLPSNPGSQGGTSDTGSGDTDSDDTASDDTGSDDGASDDVVASSQKVDSCRSMKNAISDFKLNVASIENSPSNGKKGQIETLDSSLSSTSTSLRIRVNQNLTLDKLNIVLSQNGNQLLFKDGTFADLRTPSAQQSGIKVHLSSTVSIEAGKTYTLTLDFDLYDQIVASGNKCLFRPVIPTGNITIAN
ncbi:MAG: DUF4382 domain-containing protein [Bdellovibrionaceae bacterium]|nr:DUF4382 domain-containing protein [Pseudobdellovibrionaceae bacterium]